MKWLALAKESNGIIVMALSSAGSSMLKKAKSA
jgi:hypothetical protein